MKKININNRKATFEYTILDKYTSGIMLLGTEIKSIRNNQVNISDAYCIFIQDELFIKDMHISEYNNASFINHEPKRNRKLLLNRIELNKIESKVKEKGMSIVPIRLFSNEKGKIKLEISLAKGKKIFDKRESIKEKDIKRDIDRLKKI
mgnify:CR=1 FL=1